MYDPATERDLAERREDTERLHALAHFIRSPVAIPPTFVNVEESVRVAHNNALKSALEAVEAIARRSKREAEREDDNWNA